MFQETILVHNQQLNNLLNKNKRFIYLSEIMNNQNIDISFKAFFNAEVEWWIYEEAIRRKTNINFEYENDQIKQSLFNIDHLLYNAARFDKMTLKVTIDSAITTLLNYFLRPRTALKWFVYRGEPTKPFTEIIKRLNYFSEYNYLIQGFVQYIEENHLQRNPDDLFSVIEFNRIIEKIDNDYLFTLLPEDFINLLLPVFKFFNPALPEIDLKTPVPTEALIIFLDDKGIEPLKLLVENHLIQNKLKYINGEQFLQIIYNLLNQMDTDGISISPTTESEINVSETDLLDIDIPPSSVDFMQGSDISSENEEIPDVFEGDIQAEVISQEMDQIIETESEINSLDETLVEVSDVFNTEPDEEANEENLEAFAEIIPEEIISQEMDDLTETEIEVNSPDESLVDVSDVFNPEQYEEANVENLEAFAEIIPEEIISQEMDDILETVIEEEPTDETADNQFAEVDSDSQSLEISEVSINLDKLNISTSREINVEETSDLNPEDSAESDEMLLEEEQKLMQDFKELSDLSNHLNNTFSSVLELRDQINTETETETLKTDEPIEIDSVDIANEDTNESNIPNKSFDQFKDGEDILKFEKE